MKLAKGILVSVLSMGVLTGCGISEEDQAKIDKYDELSTKYAELQGKYEDATGETLEETEESTEENEELEPKIGEYFEVEYTDEYDEEIEGLLGIKVVSVTETAERTFSEEEKNIEHIAFLELELTNKCNKELEIRDQAFNVVDGEGFQGKTFDHNFPGIKGDTEVTIPKGGKVRAYFRYEVGTPEPYAVQVGDMVIK